VFIEAKDDGGGGDNWTTGTIIHYFLNCFNTVDWVKWQEVEYRP